MDWDSGTNIVSITVGGNHKGEDATELSKKFQEFVIDSTTAPFKILVNGSDSCKGDPESRRIHTEFIRKNFKKRPGAVALCSSSLFIKMIGKFVITVAPNAKLRIFDKVEDGINWLKSLPN